MRKEPHIMALVPMRHSSERVKGKNYRPFGGRPLYHRIVETLHQSRRVSGVVIDTDSEHIKEDAGKHFPDVILIDRPEHLRSGTTPMNDVLLHDVGRIDADFYLQTHSTNPLLTTETIDRAIEAFLDAYPARDSLFAVTRMQTRLWDPQGRPINHDPSVLLRTQDLESVFEENSNLYIFTRESLETCKNRIGMTPMMFEVDAHEAVDIDDDLDFVIAETLFLKRQGRSRYGA
jgi:CMP-N-acetylneuraminic acid synthetase